jgi:molecular chaperone DnaK (HSP70)
VTASRTSIGPTIGIDFGTTNTVIAIADPDGRTEALTFHCGGELFRVYMSALCFWEERRDGALHTRVEGGRGPSSNSWKELARIVSFNPSRLSRPAVRSRELGFSANDLNSRISWRRSFALCGARPANRPSKLLKGS